MAWRSEENEHQRPWYWIGLLRIIRGRIVRRDIDWATLHSLEQRQMTTVTDNSFVCSTIYSGQQQRKRQTPRSWGFVRETHDLVIPITKCRLFGNRFYVNMSSCGSKIKEHDTRQNEWIFAEQWWIWRDTCFTSAFSGLKYPNVTITMADRKIHGANMGPNWGRQDPGGPHVAPWTLLSGNYIYSFFAYLRTFPSVLSKLFVWNFCHMKSMILFHKNTSF